MRWTFIACAALVASGCDKKAKVDDKPPPPPSPPALASSIDVPVVTASGLASPGDRGIAIVVVPRGIVVDGELVVAIKDGRVDIVEKEGGALGLKIPKVRAFLEKQVAATGVSDALIQIDRSLPYGLLVEVLFSARDPVKQFSLVVKSDGVLRSIPIAMPKKSPGRVVVTSGDAPPPDPATLPVGLIVTVERDRIMVWSVSGLEGTLKEPKLSTTADQAGIAELSKVLTEIVARRWAGKPQTEREIVVMPRSTLPMQVVAEVTVAAHRDAAGNPLFSAIHLAMGFE